MIISIIGNSNLNKMSKLLNKSKEEIEQMIAETARIVAESGNEILAVPDYAQAFFIKKYKEASGKKAIGSVPLDDKRWGCSWLEQDICDEVMNTGNWLENSYEIMINADLVLMIGYGPGTISELMFLKYPWKAEKPMPRVLIIEDFLRAKIPEELAFNMKNIEYIKLSELKEAL